MNFIGFITFSSLEYITLFFMSLVLFRFDIKDNIVKFLIFSVVLSFVSNTLQTESLRTVSPLIHIALYIPFVMYFLRINLFNSAVMMITGQVIYMMTQWVIIVSILESGILTSIEPYTKNAFIIQSATAFIMFMIGIITYLQKGGFSFIDHNTRIKRSKLIVAERRSFAFFLVFSVVITTVSNIYFVISDNPPLLTITILMVIALVGLVYTCMKRDDHADDRIVSSPNR